MAELLKRHVTSKLLVTSLNWWNASSPPAVEWLMAQARPLMSVTFPVASTPCPVMFPFPSKTPSSPLFEIRPKVQYNFFIEEIHIESSDLFLT